MFRASYLTPSQRRALLALTLLVVAATLAVWFWHRRHPRAAARPPAADTLTAAAAPTQGTLHPFDPNTADSATFVRLGLTPRIAGRICHYRAAGGRFRRAEDLARIYGMDTAALRRLRPYIRIAAVPGANPSFHEPRPLEKSHYAYTPYPSRKLPRGRQLDLNAADSAELLRVPGVGPYFARRIVRYRERLGGFVSPEQLREIPNLPDSVQTWFHVTAEKAQRPLRLNTATFRELLRHPYLNYEQVKAIVNYRERQGALQTLQELSLSEAFSAADLERLVPYVSFE
ncbi:MAG: helix-hairpin-helix domain-containing protein [Bacteroidaceae bacterium]|nr:helix-hairpin-helix domain-containing protein [Bacteroidaceae bacterium]